MGDPMNRVRCRGAVACPGRGRLPATSLWLVILAGGCVSRYDVTGGPGANPALQMAAASNWPTRLDPRLACVTRVAGATLEHSREGEIVLVFADRQRLKIAGANPSRRLSGDLDRLPRDAGDALLQSAQGQAFIAADVALLPAALIDAIGHSSPPLSTDALYAGRALLIQQPAPHVSGWIGGWWRFSGTFTLNPRQRDALSRAIAETGAAIPKT